MDDESKELAKIGMEVALRPVTEIAENLLGRIGGDWLSENRARNRARLKEKTNEILRLQKVEQPREPSPSIVVPLLSSAQDEGREELLGLWAKLLAASMDPTREKNYRREFVDIVKRFEPLDALVLREVHNATSTGNQLQEIADKLGRGRVEIDVSLRNLKILDCVDWVNHDKPFVSSLGRQLLLILGG